MVRWLRWHCPPDTGFEIRALAVWGRVRYLSVTEAPHNTNFHTWMGKKQFCFFQTAETGNRTPDSGVKGSGANHYPRAPALLNIEDNLCDRELAYSASDCQGSNSESCVWRVLSSHSSHHPQGVLVSQFSLYVHIGCLKSRSFFHFMTSKVDPRTERIKIFKW